MSASITIHVKMDAGIFRRFALFDTFRLRRRWLSPCLFSAILLFFSVICFLLTDREQSALLGTVLLVVGIGLPLCYFLNFFLQLRDQTRRFGLRAQQPVYTLILTDAQVRITNDMKEEPEVTLPWAQVMGVWRDGKATYLYANAARAFILPDGQADCSPSALWDFLSACLPAEKLHGSRP